MDILMQQRRQIQTLEVDCLSLKSIIDNILKGFYSTTLNHQISKDIKEKDTINFKTRKAQSHAEVTR